MNWPLEVAKRSQFNLNTRFKILNIIARYTGCKGSTPIIKNQTNLRKVTYTQNFITYILFYSILTYKYKNTQIITYQTCILYTLTHISLTVHHAPHPPLSLQPLLYYSFQEFQLPHRAFRVVVDQEFASSSVQRRGQSQRSLAA